MLGVKFLVAILFKIFINSKKNVQTEVESSVVETLCWPELVGQLTFSLHLPFPFKAFVLGKRRLVYLESSCWLFMTGLTSLIGKGLELQMK